MAEGMSIRSIVRMTGVSKNTIIKLLVDAGEAFSAYQDRTFRNLPCKRLQLDEIWSFVYAKEANAPEVKKLAGEAGDVWTWTAIDAETKVIPSWYVGHRDTDAAKAFVNDLAGRLTNRVQLTSDGHRPYLEAVEVAFGADIDYAMLIKHYSHPKPENEARRRYSPTQCIGSEMRQLKVNRIRNTSAPAMQNDRIFL
jgi:IS1 family transposase